MSKQDKNHKKGKEEKEKKKKKGHGLAAFVLIVLIILGLIVLMNYLGLGFGGGKGKENDKEVTRQTTESKENTKNTVSVKVSGSTYYYNEEKFTLNEIEENIKALGDNVVVTISDDSAIQNSMEELTDMFKKNNIEYVVSTD